MMWEAACARRMFGVVVGMLVGLFAVLAPAGPAAAAPGDVDLSFGRSGRVVIGEDGSHEALAMAVGPDDSIYVLSLLPPECSQCLGLEVRKFSPDGALESSYSPAPLVAQATRVEFRSGALAVAPDGSVLVAAGRGDGFEVLRLLPDGQRDPSFGVAGIVKRSIGAPVRVKAVALRPDGRIVLSGVVVRRGPFPPEDGLLLAQLRDTGEADPEFGSAGMVQLGIELDSLGGLSVGSDSIDVGVAGSQEGLRVIRLTDRGELLNSLPIEPRGLKRLGLPHGVPALLPRGHGLMAVAGTDRGTAVVALDSRGDVDPRFGGNGLTFLRGFSMSVAGAVPRVARDSAGRLMLAGIAEYRTRYGDDPSLIALTRLRRDGRVDRTFAAGRTRPSIRAEFSNVVGVGTQRDGGIVVLGQAFLNCSRYCSPARYVLERYLGGSSRARCQGRRATIVGTRKSERIVGSRRGDVIAALGGGDTVRGRGGDDLICGGEGKDDLAGGPGRDRVRQ